MEKEKPKTVQEREPVFDEARYKRQFTFSFSLFFVFVAIYFFAAIITTKEFQSVATINILGLPLAFYLGIIVFVAGVAITKIYLMQKQNGVE